MCPWTRVRLGTWHSCPLLVTSSFTPSWQPMRKWSSCTWTSPEVGPRRNNSLNKSHHHNDHFIFVCFALCRHGIRYHLRVRRPGHCVLKVARAPPLHHHRGRDGLHQCHLPEGSLHHQHPRRGYLSLHAEETAAQIVHEKWWEKCFWTPPAFLMH